MKRLLTAGLALLLVAGASRLYVVAQSEQSAAVGSTLWQTGRCYRVFPSDPDTFHLFRVMDVPTGIWVRVQARPLLPQAPGVPPPAPLWLNTSSPFAVQEWPCQ